MIIKPETMTFSDKKIRMLIAGYPGIGKTTLALSAPRPLYIDVDLSAERINREVLNLAAGITQPRDYEELRRDLGLGVSDADLQAVKENLSGIDTIVIDTGGKLLTIMGQYGKKVEQKYAQRDGSLSLKGYGWLGKEFQRFLDHIIYQLNKHIVIVFHTVEDKDGDDTKLRIKAEGSSKNSVWEVMDLGGFMEMRGNARTIGFSNCERYFAKGTRGISGVIPIPELSPSTPNDFLTKLFERYNEVTQKEKERAEAERASYDAAMKAGLDIVAGIADVETANAAIPRLSEIQHCLTSRKELGAALREKIKACGLKYEKEAGVYVQEEAPDAQEETAGGGQ